MSQLNITLNPDLEKRISDKVASGEIGSADAFVEEALQFYLDYEFDPNEAQETQEAIDEALAQGERGEGRPAADVFTELRAKHGLSR